MLHDRVVVRHFVGQLRALMSAAIDFRFGSNLESV